MSDDNEEVEMQLQLVLNGKQTREFVGKNYIPDISWGIPQAFVFQQNNIHLTKTINSFAKKEKKETIMILTAAVGKRGRRPVKLGMFCPQDILAKANDEFTRRKLKAVKRIEKANQKRIDAEQARVAAGGKTDFQLREDALVARLKLYGRWCRRCRDTIDIDSPCEHYCSKDDDCDCGCWDEAKRYNYEEMRMRKISNGTWEHK